MTIMQQLEEIREALRKCQYLIKSDPMNMLGRPSNEEMDQDKEGELKQEEFLYPDNNVPTTEELLSLEAQEEEPKEFEK